MRKVAVITGGSRGIGRACVRAFAGAGYDTVFLCRKETEKAQALVDALHAEGLNAKWFQCDVSDAEQVKNTFSNILKVYHRVDALVNNAGIAAIGLFQDTTEEAFDHLFDVNVKGAFLCAKAVVPSMIEHQCGSIINLSSMWGEVGASCEVVYSASKAALIGMTKALAKELGPSGIRVNCVSPGTIDTDMNGMLDEETKAALAEDTPLQRLGTPEEVADIVLFLSGDASSFITGQVIGVNGGFVI